VFIPLTPIDFKKRAVRLYGKRPAVVDGEKRFTYAEFGQRTNRLANALLAMGLCPGDRVAFLAYNSHPLLEAYYGVLEAGGVLLPINIRLHAKDVAHVISDSGARFLFVDRDLASFCDDVTQRVELMPEVVWLSGRPQDRYEPVYDEILAGASPEPPPTLEVDENQVAELFYTSGTTGRPKGVMLTHRNLALHALHYIGTMPVSDRTVQLHTIPLYHVNGWGTPQYLTLAGGTHVMMQKFDPRHALGLIEAERVTQFLAVPTMLNMLLNRPDLGEYDLSSLEFVLTGGAPTPVEMIRRAEALLGCTVRSGYGLSETSPILTIAVDKQGVNEEEGKRIQRQASTGLPLVGVDLRVVKGDGREVAWDAEDTGEIVVRSNVVMDGYWNDSAATDAVIRDGWFHTGDLATVDSEGYVLIVDRTKDIIVSGGENISSMEIEMILFEHPGILEAAVIAVPDDDWGEAVMAIVSPRAGYNMTEADVQDFCRKRMARFKVPKSVEFREALPKGGTGKILKRELREPYWSDSAKKVH
jgi:fatty-acyl-CoA synthase